MLNEELNEELNEIFWRSGVEMKMKEEWREVGVSCAS